MSSDTPRFIDQPLAGWGNYPVQRCRVFRPERRRELDAVLDADGAAGCIARGLGRSYGDASLNEGGAVVLQGAFNRMRRFEPESGILECEGGTTIADIIDVMLPRGFFVPVTPGTRHVTVGGAIASDVHGKNHHRDGSFSSFVEDLVLVTASGEEITCSAAQNADVFWATVGGMGLTGIIASARLRLHRVETAYISMRTERARDLDAALERFETLDRDAKYSVAWLDCTRGRGTLGRSVLMAGDHAKAGELSGRAARAPLALASRRTRSVPFFAPAFALNPLSVRAFNGLYYARQRGGARIERYDAFFHPLDTLLDWNRLYGRRGFVQYQLLLPHGTARTGLIEVLERVRAAGAASFLTILKRFGPASAGLLSFPAEGWTLAMDLPNTGSRLLELVRELDAIVLKHGGRVYLTKDATLDRDSFEAMYDRLDEFKRVKRRLDPEGRFCSSLSRRLGITASGGGAS